jgi:hypothetical protein
MWRSRSGCNAVGAPKDDLAAKKAAGVRLGRPVSIPNSVASHIRDLRSAGLTLRDIVDHLNGEGVPTVSGRSGWRISTVQRVLARAPGAWS